MMLLLSVMPDNNKLQLHGGACSTTNVLRPFFSAIFNEFDGIEDFDYKMSKTAR